jgi:hypothetical protein
MRECLWCLAGRVASSSMLPSEPLKIGGHWLA